MSAQYFAVQVAVAASWTGTYSWAGNTISDLGNTRCGIYSGRSVCSPAHVLMNASFVVLGVSMLAGAVLVGRALAGGRLAGVGFACMGAAGAGTIVVGLSPENTTAAIHAAGAGLPFVLGNVGLVLLGTRLRCLPAGLRVGTCLAGAAGLAGLPLFLSHSYLGLGIGGMERVTAYPQDIWLVVFGAYLLMRSTDHPGAGSR